MKLLTVCRGLGLGGTERAAETFTLAYQRAGHDVAVLNLGVTGKREENLRRYNVPVWTTLDDAERFDPAIIHIHRRGQADATETGVLRRLRTPPRRVLETNVFGWADYSDANALVDVHLLLSRWCLWAWRRRLGRRAPAIVVGNPLAASQFSRAGNAEIAAFRAKWASPDATFICGRVAQPLPGKWHPSNILAFVPLAQRDPRAFLWLVGVPEMFRPLLASLPADVRARIRELPMTSSDAELALFYSSLDCFLHAARQGESFGYVLAEAMMCGCPVVTASTPTKDNSQAEVVGQMQAGIVAGSFERLGDALLSLWQDAPLRQRLAAACRARALELCDADRLAARALRAAEIALAHDDAAVLRRALETEPGFVTNADNAEIRALATNVFGGARCVDTALLKPANSATEHRLRQWLRRRRGN